PDLHDGIPALQVQDLIKAGYNVPGLDSGNDIRAKVNTADHDLTRFLAGIFEDLWQDGGELAMLGPNCFKVRMSCEVGCHHRDTFGGVAVDILGNIEFVHVTFAESFLESVKHTLRTSAPPFLVEDIPNDCLIAGFELSALDHGLPG